LGSQFYGRKIENELNLLYIWTQVGIQITILTEEERMKIFSDREDIDLVSDIKSQILLNFQSNQRLEERCRKVGQVWTTFYKVGQKREGSIMKHLIYDDGVLYYPKMDKISYERDQKLKNILTWTT